MYRLLLETSPEKQKKKKKKTKKKKTKTKKKKKKKRKKKTKQKKQKNKKQKKNKNKKKEIRNKKYMALMRIASTWQELETIFYVTNNCRMKDRLISSKIIYQ